MGIFEKGAKGIKNVFDKSREAAVKNKGAPSPVLKRSIYRENAYVSSERSITLERAIEVLGRENVHGKEDVEFLLGYTINPANIPPIPYTEADLLKSKEIKGKTGVQEMLVLFVNDKDGKPLTGERLNELVQKKYDEMGLGKFLNSVDWYANKDFYKKQGITFAWRMITKQCIPNSKGKEHSWKKGDAWKKKIRKSLPLNNTRLPSTSLAASSIVLNPWKCFTQRLCISRPRKESMETARASVFLKTNIIGRISLPRLAISCTSGTLTLAVRA